MADTTMDITEYRILKNDDYIYRDLKPKIQGDVQIGYNSSFDLEAVKNSLMNIFLVNRGEMPGKPQFGNPLQLSVFDNFDYFTESSMTQAIRVAVEKYEPRVTVLEVNISEMPEYNRLIVEIRFSVNLKENNIQDSIYLPFSRNDYTYLGGRSVKNV